MKSVIAQLQSNCLVRGHNFVRRGNEWVDAAVEKYPSARHVRIRYDSWEFFQLLQRFPKALPLLSVSRNVQVELGGTIYQIYE